MKKYVFTENDWDIFMQIQKFLQPFKEATIIMSSSIYPTLSITIPLYNTLIDHAEDTVDSVNIDPKIKEAAKKCREKLIEYYKRTDKTYLVATVLDPRFKMQYYVDNKWEEITDEIYVM